VDIDKAQAEHAAGKLHEVVIEPADEGNGWMVVVHYHGGEVVTLTDHSGVERVYHSIEHATEAAKAIGFQTVRVMEAF
jgi:hypothetical protein